MLYEHFISTISIVIIIISIIIIIREAVLAGHAHVNHGAAAAVAGRVRVVPIVLCYYNIWYVM